VRVRGCFFFLLSSRNPSLTSSCPFSQVYRLGKWLLPPVPPPSLPASGKNLPHVVFLPSSPRSSMRRHAPPLVGLADFFFFSFFFFTRSTPLPSYARKRSTFPLLGLLVCFCNTSENASARALHCVIFEDLMRMRLFHLSK